MSLPGRALRPRNLRSSSPRWSRAIMQAFRTASNAGRLYFPWTCTPQTNGCPSARRAPLERVSALPERPIGSLPAGYCSGQAKTTGAGKIGQGDGESFFPLWGSRRGPGTNPRPSPARSPHQAAPHGCFVDPTTWTGPKVLSGSLRCALPRTQLGGLPASWALRSRASRKPG